MSKRIARASAKGVSSGGSLPGTPGCIPPISAFFSAAKENLPYYFVFLCCLVFAVQLGILEPEMRYQKSFESVSGWDLGGHLWAFAKGDMLLIYLPHANSTISATFEGSGAAETLRMRFSEPMLEVPRISINGMEICAPCNQRDYRISPAQKGALVISVEANESELAAQDSGLLASAFFQEGRATHAMAPLLLFVDGGWQATPSRSIPSSFYGEDAPFHINRVEVLSEYIAAMHLPWADYSFLSVFPAAALKMLAGVTPQYAYKVCQILLFFIPIAIFHLFSKKLTVGGRAAFLFASLLYLATPMRGYLTGGAADLFVYGMTAHTLATYLSLFCFYFAYEYVWERKGLAPPVLFFMLSVLSNQRIVFVFAAMFGVMMASALAGKKLRRCALLAVACAASVAWFLVPHIYLQSFAGYSRLGGITQGDFAEALVGFLQLGYLFLPLFFAAGIVVAHAKREFFAILLGFWAIACFLIATDPGLNAVLPTLDGMRLLPSFALPVFFISGIGARGVFLSGLEFSERLRKRLGQDRETFSVCVAFALLFPFSVLYLSGVVMVWDQLAFHAEPLSVASEYESLSQADALASGSNVALLWRGETSQYSVKSSMVGKTPLYYFNSTAHLAQEMGRRGASLVVFGNENAVLSPKDDPGSKWRQYAALRADPAFEQLPLEGSLPVFRLKSAPAQGVLRGGGITTLEETATQDAVWVRGECALPNCSASILAWGLPSYSLCEASFANCSADFNQNDLRFEVGGIPRGTFYIGISAQRLPVHYYALAASAAALLVCAGAARRI